MQSTGATSCRSGRLIRAPHTPGVSLVRRKSESYPPEEQKISYDRRDGLLNEQLRQSPKKQQHTSFAMAGLFSPGMKMVQY